MLSIFTVGGRENDFRARPQVQWEVIATIIDEELEGEDHNFVGYWP